MNRRRLLRALLGAPVAGAVLEASAEATEYASAAEVFSAVDRLEAEVDVRLRALSEAAPGAKALAVSVLAEHERQRQGRARLRLWLGVPPASVVRPEIADLTSIEALREAQEALVYAHAEGLTALRDPRAVDVMAGHMVELSRQLTVTSLWIESEANRG